MKRNFETQCVFGIDVVLWVQVPKALVLEESEHAIRHATLEVRRSELLDGSTVETVIIELIGNSNSELKAYFFEVSLTDFKKK